MKKFKLFFVVFAILTSFSLLLISCGGGGGNSQSGDVGNTSLVISDGTKEDTSLNYTYNYGDDLTFISNLKLYIVNNTDKTKTELTTEQYSTVKVTYTGKDGSTKNDFPRSNEKLDVGMYSFEIKYGSYSSLYVNLEIKQIERSAYNFTMEFRTKDNYNFQAAKFGTSSIDDNKLTSEYKVKVKDPSATGDNQYVDKNNLTGIYYLKASEYSDFNALATDQLKQEYLENHKFIAIESNQMTSRQLTYNNDGPSSTEFYINTNDFNVKPGTYYLFAGIAAGNYKAFNTYPSNNTKLEIIKNNLKLSDIIFDEQGEYTAERIFELLDLKASFSYSNTQFNPTTEEWDYHYGDITLGEIENNNGIHMNDDSDFLNRIKVNLLGSTIGISGVGEFEFVNKTRAVNSNTGINGVSTQKVQFALSEYYVDYFTISDTFDIELTITKCNVDAPYMGKYIDYEYDSNTGVTTEIEKITNSFTYDVKEYDVFTGQTSDDESTIPGLISNYDAKLMELVSGYNQSKGTNVGEYKLRIKLKDSVNYTFVEDDTQTNRYYGDTNREFVWNIDKGENPIDFKYTYNGVSYDTTQAYDLIYDRSHKTIAVEIIDRDNIFSNRTVNWSLDQGNMPTGVNVSIDTTQHGLTNTITYSGINDYGSFYGNLGVMLNIVVEESANYKESELQPFISITSGYTDQEIQSFIVDIPSTKNENGDYYKNGIAIIHSKTNKTDPDHPIVTYYVRSELYPPQASLSTLGEWKMYLVYYPADDSDKQIYEVSTTDTEWQIPNYNPDDMSWALCFRTEIYYLFIPNDTLLPTFRIDIDTNDFDKYIIRDDDEL